MSATTASLTRCARTATRACYNLLPITDQLATMTQTIIDLIGNTPMIQVQRLYQGSNTLLLKLENQNPAGSVKDRPAASMILCAEERGDIQPGDTLIEPTSGNTGIALAMVAACKGYRLVLVMPDNMSAERRAIMKAYGAEIILTPGEQAMEGARDKAEAMVAAGEGKMLDQFANPDNPLAHYTTTGPEIWRDTQGQISHFVSSMGTTGTAMGAGRFLKEQNQQCQIIGVQPAEGAKIPGIRSWPKAYLPKIYDASRIDRLMEVTQEEAEDVMRRLADQEGLFCGISSGGCTSAALRLAEEVHDAVIVAIVCDGGDRYISTGVFPA